MKDKVKKIEINSLPTDELIDSSLESLEEGGELIIFSKFDPSMYKYCINMMFDHKFIGVSANCIKTKEGYFFEIRGIKNETTSRKL